MLNKLKFDEFVKPIVLIVFIFSLIHNSKTELGGIIMSRKISILVFLLVAFVNIELTFAEARIIRLSGEVRIRRGVEETWQVASTGILLEDIDTIQTGTTGTVVLETKQGNRFTLGSDAILDISDLRKITEKELFLYLMSKKVQNIEPRDSKTPLRIGNVSVVHGESKAKPKQTETGNSDLNLWIKEKNGANALYDQEYFPNSIIKYHKILDKYRAIHDCGEIYFYLGKSFEALNKTGQAFDSYKLAIQHNQGQNCQDSKTQKWLTEAQKSLERLKLQK